MTDILRPDGQLVNGSASQRQIAALEQLLRNSAEQIQHLRAHIAVIAYNAGGSVSIQREDMAFAYDIELVISEDQKTLTWTSLRQKGTSEQPPPV
jgi:hypothetical protein